MPTPSSDLGSRAALGVTTSSAQRTRGWVLNATPVALEVLGIVGGVLLGAHQYLRPGSTLGAWFTASKGWELNAFDAFGTMSGFSLAALALVASLSTHQRASEILDENPGRYLLRTLIAATWAWFLAALASLVALAAGSSLVNGVVVLATCWASARGLIALLALALFFKRFTVRRPY